MCHLINQSLYNSGCAITQGGGFTHHHIHAIILENTRDKEESRSR